MDAFRQNRTIQAIVSIFVTLSLVIAPVAYAAEAVIPDGTTVYLSTMQTVIGKKNETAVGNIVPARVWRDVVVDGQIAIKGGTPAIVEVSSIKSRKIFGIKGKMSLAAIQTSTVDGQTGYLTGGYNKEGKSRVGWSLGLSLLVWPALFLPGKAAELPTGTVMDSFTSGTMTVSIKGKDKPRATINLGSMMSGFSVEVLYDLLMEVEKPTYFDFLITTDLDAPSEFSIDVVNNAEIQPIALEVLSVETDEENEEKSVRAKVKIKTLAKKFKKGINTFEVSYDNDGERESEEVVLQIEM